MKSPASGLTKAHPWNLDSLRFSHFKMIGNKSQKRLWVHYRHNQSTRVFILTYIRRYARFY